MKNKEKQTVPKLRFKGYTDAWQQRKSAEIAEYSKGNGYSKNDLTATGTPIILYGRLYTKYQFVIDDVDTFAVAKSGSVFSKGGEVIIPASGETAEDIARAAVVAKSGVLLGSDLNILRPVEQINPTFFAIAISNGKSQEELAKKAQGKSIVHIHNSDIQKITISFSTRAEQDRIVNLFTFLDHLITLLQRKLDKHEALKKALLQNLFPEKKQTVPSLRFKGFSENWQHRKLGKISSFSKGMEKISKNDLLLKGKYPIIHYADLYKFKPIQSKIFHYINHIISSPIPKNSLLFPGSDVTPNGLARTSTMEKENVYAGGDVIIAELSSTDIKSKFLTFEINYHKDKIIPLITGTTIRHLHIKELQTLPINYPNLSEQDKIGNLLSKFDKTISLLQKQINTLNSLKQFLLQNMFI